MGDSPVLTPRLGLIVPADRLDAEAGWRAIEAALSGGVDLVLLRAPAGDAARLLAVAARLRACTRAHRARLFIHSHFAMAEAVDADGVHLPAAAVAALAARGARVRAGRTVSASAHDADELARAAAIGCAFAYLSPVFPTRSHPGAPALGPARFRALAARAPLPVVALGGIAPTNRAALGEWPVAAISAILDAADPAAAARALRRSGAVKTRSPARP